MHKKPIYGGRIYSDRSNSDITFCDFLKKVTQHQRGFSGRKVSRIRRLLVKKQKTIDKEESIVIFS